MKTVALVQARMGSTRFFGKVLKELHGKAVLWHIIHRLRKCRTVDFIAVATSTHALDSRIESFCETIGVAVYRGSESHVLQRFVDAANHFHADIIVRVTGDAPLIDPHTIDRMVQSLVDTNSEYCFGHTKGPCILEGFDPVRVSALTRLLSQHGQDATAKEHVTSFFKLHPDFVGHTSIELGDEFAYEGARTSVDSPEDLQFLNAIYERLDCPAGDADIRDVVKLLRTDPTLLSINSNVMQRGITNVHPTVIFRCDGTATIGMGHLMRCMSLAEELRTQHGAGIIFAIASDDLAVERAERKGFRTIRIDLENECSHVSKLIDTEKPAILVIDTVLSTMPCSFLHQLYQARTPSVIIDSSDERRLGAQLAVYPPVPQVKELDWSRYQGRILSDWNYVILHRRFLKTPTHGARHSQPPHILITMGGADPADLTISALRALNKEDHRARISVVIGPAFRNRTAIQEIADRKTTILVDLENMVETMDTADVALCSFGMTAYELAQRGVPAIYLCLTNDHCRSADACAKAGIGINLGHYSSLGPENLARTVLELATDQQRKDVMNRRGRCLIDGRGAERVASELMNLAKNTPKATEMAQDHST